MTSPTKTAMKVNIRLSGGVLHKGFRETIFRLDDRWRVTMPNDRIKAGSMVSFYRTDEIIINDSIDGDSKTVNWLKLVKSFDSVIQQKV